jgi:hypothetical protein
LAQALARGPAQAQAPEQLAPVRGAGFRRR